MLSQVQETQRSRCTLMTPHCIASQVYRLDNRISQPSLCNKNEMIVHPAKCEAMHISNTHFTGPIPQLTIGGTMVKLVNSTRT